MEGIKQMLIEHPINVPDMNVKGFVDIVTELESGEVYVYDIKTIGSWSWRFKLGNNSVGAMACFSCIIIKTILMSGS